MCTQDERDRLLEETGISPQDAQDIRNQVINLVASGETVELPDYSALSTEVCMEIAQAFS